MASIINASTSGAGGVITTADASGVLNIQTAGTTAISVNASQAVTLTNALPIGSGGTGVTTGPFGMTLLGTITPTAVNSISLGSLTLTGYKALYIAYNNITASQAVYISSDNRQSGGGVGAKSSPVFGTMWLDLTTGALGGSVYISTIDAGGTNNANLGGSTNVTTSTTTIYFRNTSTTAFGAAGSIAIYGVK